MNRKPSGFTLLEVLIAVLILSVGLLALASLQTRGLATGHNAYLRSQAVVLARDMAERIRANNNYAVETENNANTEYTISFDGKPKSQNCVDTVCTPEQIASYDLNQWLTTLANALPSGDGQITKIGLNYQITVQWNTNQRNNSNDDNPSNNVALKSVKSYSLAVNLRS